MLQNSAQQAHGGRVRPKLRLHRIIGCQARILARQPIILQLHEAQLRHGPGRCVQFCTGLSLIFLRQRKDIRGGAE